MAVIKTLKGETVLTVVCNVVYHEPPPEKEEANAVLLEHIEKMASAWRVVSFFLIVFVLPVLLIAVPLYARYTLYPARTLALMAADTIDLHSMVSTFWCQGQRVKSNGTFDAYLLPDAPSLNRKRRKVTVGTSVMKVTEEEPEVKIVHLLKDSSFRLAVCSRWPGATVIVVQGEENFRRCYYKEDEDADDILELQRELAQAREKASEERKASPRLRQIASTSPRPQKSSDKVITSSEHSKKDAKKTVKAVELPPTNADVFGSDGGSNGGEIIEDNFIDEENNLDGNEQELPIVDNELISPLRISNKSQNKSRVVRSITDRRDDSDGSDEHRLKEEEAMIKLGLLHSVNDTRDVTAGNSSISSSEEFMQQCTSTILNLSVDTLVDCQAQNVEDNHNWFFKINETDNYYFIFMSDNSLEENVLKYYLEVDRVMYNITENTDACTNSTECIFPMRFMSSESVVLELSEQNKSQLVGDIQTFEMETHCQPRVAVYMIFILMVPIIILMFAFQ